MNEPVNASVTLDIEALSMLLDLATEAQESVEDIRLDEAKVALASLTAWLWSYNDFAEQKGANLDSSVAHSFDEKGEEAGGNAGSIPAASTKNIVGTAQELRRDFDGTRVELARLNVRVAALEDAVVAALEDAAGAVFEVERELDRLCHRVSSVEEGIEASFETDEQLQELRHRVKLLEARFRQ